MNDTDDDRLTEDEQVVMLRIAVRVLARYDEHALSCRVERVADAIQLSAQDGKSYRPIDA